MAEPLTYAQIDDLCTYYVISADTYYIGMQPIIETLYNTGLRINEVVNLERWFPAGEGGFGVYTEKGSDPRFFSASAIPVAFQSLVYGKPESVMPYTAKQVGTFLNNFNPYGRTMVGDKNVSTHIFRYRYAKSLAEQGYDASVVRTYMGLSNDLVALGYMQARIDYTGQQPVYSS